MESTEPDPFSAVEAYCNVLVTVMADVSGEKAVEGADDDVVTDSGDSLTALEDVGAVMRDFGVVVAAVLVAGYSFTSKVLTSSGSFAYHSGVTSPVGNGTSGPVGIATLSTERTENRAGSMVLGSMARARCLGSDPDSK